MFYRLMAGFFLITTVAGWPVAIFSQTEDASPNIGSARLEAQLERAGQNRPQWERALAEVAPDQRTSLVFLLSHMPEPDLRNLTAEFVLDHVRLAHEARNQMKWGPSIPDELFLNDVLPYAHVDETRESWRKDLFQIAYPIVKDCRTPGEAAQALNEKLFGAVQVKYSTRRKKANQAPGESIEQGLASCTGLSILLADACRSVAVPARLAGIPSWPNKRGNHTWVEVWDDGWHFTGAAEPDPRGLNHTWFQGDAALAEMESRNHAIYAVSFAETGTTFPAVWSRNRKWPIHAVNVTERYTADGPEMETGKVQAMIRVWNQGRQVRIAAKVRLIDGDETLEGTSRGPQADMNDMLTFSVDPDHSYRIELIAGDRTVQRTIDVSGEANQVFELEFSHVPEPAPVPEPLSPEEAESLLTFFAGESDAESRPLLPESLAQKYLQQTEAVRKAIWLIYRESKPARSLKSDYDANQVRYNEHLSPYTVKEVGERPENGWPLFIAMHGGGNAPARVNDSQWRHMQIYYKEHPELGGYKYLALRAPNDTWNGFYDDYVYPLVENLIAQMVIHGDVDPQKVFAMGYSHGGYGAFSIGPKIPYRFAAVHSSAAAPTDGESSARTLRNLRFTFMVGEKDNAYGRRERCEKFASQIEQLKKESPDDYPVEFLFQEGYGHGGLPDRDMITRMYEFQREPAPRHVTWEMTDGVVDHFYWLEAPQPAKQSLLDARWEENRVAVEAENVTEFVVWYDERLMADPDQPVRLVVNGKQVCEVDTPPSVVLWCESLRERRDPLLAYDRRMEVQLPAAGDAGDADGQ